MPVSNRGLTQRGAGRADLENNVVRRGLVITSVIWQNSRGTQDAKLMDAQRFRLRFQCVRTRRASLSRDCWPTLVSSRR